MCIRDRIRGVARFISVYEGEYSRERLVQQLARTHPKTITQLAQKDVYKRQLWKCCR